MKAAFQHRLDADRVRCDLCPHHCVLREGEAGICKVRGVRGGDLKALCYGIVTSAGLDPMEKKPLYHFHPGRKIFSIGGWGCNLACEFCQNWTISQHAEEQGRAYRPESIVHEAKRSGSVGIAYTYNEPAVGYEFMKATAALAIKEGLVNVMVTNGFIAREPAAELLPLVDALNIDIKSIRDDFYRKLCHGSLDPVLKFSKQASEAGCHVEITNLIVPGANDRGNEVAELADWISGHLGKATPLHLSAYHPEFKMDAGPTSGDLIESLYHVCKDRLDYVYIGNVRTKTGQNTLCPGCGAVLIQRRGYSIEICGIQGNTCAGCGRKADIRI